MNEHQLYSFVYIILTWIITFVQSYRIRRMSNKILLFRNNYSWGVVVFMLLLVMMIGFRPVMVGADTGAYMSKFQKMMIGSWDPNESTLDRLFSFFQYACAQVMSVSMFFLIVAFLYVFSVYIACKRLLINNAAFMVLCFIGAFSFFAYGVNGIRNGLATSFVILALSFVSGNLKDKLYFLLFCIVAINIHRSTALPIFAMLFSYLYKRPKFMFYVWGIALLGSLLVGQTLSGLFAVIGFDKRLSGYMALEETEETAEAIATMGFRWDFLLYSFIPILLGWYCIFKKKVCDLTYHLLLGTYIYSNAVWVILIRIPFSNRFAYLSWFLYGIVLAYPLFKFNLWRNQGSKVQWIMMAHVSFTFFMWFYTGL